MSCEGYPTAKTAKTFNQDAGTINEMVTLEQDRTNPASDGKTKKTIWGIENDAALQRDNIENLAEAQRQNIDSTFTSQFAYKRIGNISAYVGDVLQETDKLNSYQYPDDSGEWYGPVQSQDFPITIPSDPSINDGWSLVTAATNQYVTNGDSLVSDGGIFQLTVNVGPQSTSIPNGISRLKVITGSGDIGIELLYLWESSGDFSSSDRLITDISENELSGYDVTTSTGVFEFVNLKTLGLRGMNQFPTVKREVYPEGWGAKADPEYSDESLQACFDAVSGGGSVFLSQNYITTKPVIINNTNQFIKAISINGAGTGVASIKKTGVATSGLPSVTGPSSPDSISMDVDAVLVINPPNLNYAGSISISNIDLIGDDSGNASKFGLYAPLTRSMSLKNILINDIGVGFRTNDSFITDIFNVGIRDCIDGFSWVRAGATISGTGTTLSMKNSGVLRSSNKAFTFVNLIYSSFEGCYSDVLGTANTGWQFDACRGISMRGIGTESSVYTNAFIDVLNNSSISIDGITGFNMGNVPSSSADGAIIKARLGSTVQIDNDTLPPLSTLKSDGVFPYLALNNSHIITNKSIFSPQDITGRQIYVDSDSSVSYTYEGETHKVTSKSGDQDKFEPFNGGVTVKGSKIVNNSSQVNIGYVDIPESNFAQGAYIEIQGFLFGNSGATVSHVKAVDDILVYGATGAITSVTRQSFAVVNSSATSGYIVSTSVSKVTDVINYNRVTVSVQSTDNIEGTLYFNINTAVSDFVLL